MSEITLAEGTNTNNVTLKSNYKLQVGDIVYTYMYTSWYRMFDLAGVEEIMKIEHKVPSGFALLDVYGDDATKAGVMKLRVTDANLANGSISASCCNALEERAGMLPMRSQPIQGRISVIQIIPIIAAIIIICVLIAIAVALISFIKIVTTATNAAAPAIKYVVPILLVAGAALLIYWGYRGVTGKPTASASSAISNVGKVASGTAKATGTALKAGIALL